MARNIIFDTKWGFGAYFLLFLPTFKAKNTFFLFLGLWHWFSKIWLYIILSGHGCLESLFNIKADDPMWYEINFWPIIANFSNWDLWKWSVLLWTECPWCIPLTARGHLTLTFFPQVWNISICCRKKCGRCSGRTKKPPVWWRRHQTCGKLNIEGQ